MKTSWCIVGFVRTLPAVLIVVLSGCRGNAQAQTAFSSALSASPTMADGLIVTSSPTATAELTSPTSNASTPESTPTSEPTFTASPTAMVEVTAATSDTATPESAPTSEPTLTPLPPPFFDGFVSSLINGRASQVVGVYVDGVMALKVVQQPASDPAYVSTEPGAATYFTLVTKMTGNTGLLAHNYLAGIYYYNLRPGQSVVIIHGDGSTTEYVVSNIDNFQALSPNSPTSNFVNMSTGETLSATDLFYQVYAGSSRTTFQTCITQGLESSWGRLFVIAPHE
jgi:hypothetical protein